jgi:predicted SprT family Zn-dependent metalloprotease
MILAPVTLEHGERYGKLTVLEKIVSKERGPKYKCGCACGFQRVFAKASDLMRGRVNSCLKCRGLTR